MAAKVLVGTGIEQVWPIGLLNKAIRTWIRTRTVHIDDLTFHLDPLDALNLSILRDYEPIEHALFKQVIRPSDTVIDIGANIGFFTVHFSRMVGEKGQVHAFEPDPENQALLQANLQENACANAHPNSQALSSTTGISKLYRSEEAGVDHHLYASEEARDSIEVHTVSLDDYCREHDLTVDFIKMDIQGAEPMALAGMHRVLAETSALKLLTEFWPFGLEASGHSGEAYLDSLLEAGFVLHEHNEQKDTWDPVSKNELLSAYTVANQVHTNLYCTKKD